MMRHLGLVAGEPQRDLVILVEPEVSLEPVRHDLRVVEIETWNITDNKYDTRPRPCCESCIELQTKVRKDFTIKEKQPITYDICVDVPI